jgi:hypothetical protein
VVAAAENAVTLCDLGIFADQAAEPVAPENPDVGAWSRRIRTPGRRVLPQCPVRPVRIVVTGVLREDQPQVPLASDQHPVGALGPCRADEPLGDRVHPLRLRRGRYHLDPASGKDRVERGGELGVPVPDQVGELASGVGQVGGQLAGQLGGLCRSLEAGDAQQVNMPGVAYPPLPERAVVYIGKSASDERVADERRWRQGDPRNNIDISLVTLLRVNQAVLQALHYNPDTFDSTK